MKVSVSSGLQVKFYFDLMCPNSWIAWNVLKGWSKTHPQHQLDLLPINDFYLEVVRSNRITKLRKSSSEYVPNTLPVGSRKHVIKELSECPSYSLPDNWKEIYSSDQSRSILPSLFLTALREHHPHLLRAGYTTLGNRFWEKGLPLNKGCFLATCTKEIGLSYRDSEMLISRLPHRDYREILRNTCKTADSLGIEMAPLFVVEDTENKELSNVLTNLPALMKLIS